MERGETGHSGSIRSFAEQESFPDPEAEKILYKGRTYDDVLLIPGYSEIRPAEANIQTRLTKGLTLNAGLVSAAMDTVTESSMAIALARQGGAGVLHKNMSIESQAAEVERVKRASSALIKEPISLPATATVEDFHEIKRKHGIGSVMVVDDEGRLLGRMTKHEVRPLLIEQIQSGRGDMRTDVPISELYEPFEKREVLTCNGGEPTWEDAMEAFASRENKDAKLIAVVDEKGALRGLYVFKDIYELTKYPNAAKAEDGRLIVGAAVGVDEVAQERADTLVEAGADFLVVDTGHAHSKRALEVASGMKARHPEIQLIVGNVATAEGTRAVIEAGADAVKVGIGPGSICTTRVVTGVGMPQFTAVARCAAEAGRYGVPVIADGGIRHYGDIAKAIGAGAESVMIGSKFAAVEESPGKTVLLEGRRYREIRGMGSEGAMAEGSADRYGYDINTAMQKLVPEGVEGLVAYEGKLSEMTYQMTGSFRASLAYTGYKSVPDMAANARFVELTGSALKENHPSVHMTKESANYSTGG